MKYAIGIAALLLVCVLFIAVIGIERSLLWFIDMPTFLGYVLVISGVIFATGEFNTKVRLANALFSKKYVLSAQDKERGIRLCKLLQRTVLYAMAFFVMAPLIVLMGRLDDPSAIGPALAIILLSVVYGVLINLIVIIPATHILEGRTNPEGEKIVISEKQVVDKLLELCYKKGISPEEILAASEINFDREN